MSASETPEHWRLFIAIQIPDPVKDRIEQAQAALRRACAGAKIRWARRDQFHLTLRFMGYVDAARIPELESVLHATCGRFAPLRLRAQGIGFFPPARPPRVVWVGIDGGEPLRDIQRATECAAIPFTSEPAEKAFTGHITLGRVREIRPPEASALAKIAGEISSTNFGEWTADHFKIVRSRLAPEGASYSTVGQIRFS